MTAHVYSMQLENLKYLGISGYHAVQRLNLCVCESQICAHSSFKKLMYSSVALNVACLCSVLGFHVCKEMQNPKLK